MGYELSGPEGPIRGSHWIIIDPRPPGYIGQEIVDLSAAAIELRRVARSLRAYADEAGHWIDLEKARLDERVWPEKRSEHVADVSFGLRFVYAVEFDPTGQLFQGQPIRHLRIASARTQPTPATIGEIATYFYGRRRAHLRVTEIQAHVVVGFEWEPLDIESLLKLV